jgi:hypothetical protein
MTQTIDRRKLLERGGAAALGTALFAAYNPRVASAATTTMPAPNGIDDSSALQNALNANGEVRFDAYRGQSYLLANVMVPSRSKITGAGPGNTIFKLKDDAPRNAAGNYGIFLNAGWEGSGDTDITIEGVEFDGNVLINHAIEQTAGCQWYGTRRMWVRDCYFHDWRGEGMVWRAHNSALVLPEDVHVSNVVLNNMGSNADGGWAGNRRQGLFVKAGRNITFQGITARLCYSFTIDLEGGNNGDLIQGITIDDVACYDCYGGIAVSTPAGATDCRVSNLTMRDGPTLRMTQAIHSEEGTVRLTVDNVSGDSNFAGPVVDITRATDATLSNISSTGVTPAAAAIRLDSCQGTLITGARLRDGGGQTYAVEEVGASDYTIVTAYHTLGGSLGQTKFVGPNSRVR